MDTIELLEELVENRERMARETMQAIKEAQTIAENMSDVWGNQAGGND